jgi:hypothetical protein
MTTPRHAMMAATLAAAALFAAGCTTTAPRQQAPATQAAAAPPAAAAVPGNEATVLAAAASHTSGARRLSGEEYRRIVAGNTLVRQTAGGGTMMIHLEPDGRQTLRLTNAAGQSGSDRGRQEIAADRVCSRWDRIEPGRQTCFAWFVRGGTLIAVDLSGRFTPVEYQIRRGGLPAT